MTVKLVAASLDARPFLRSEDKDQKDQAESAIPPLDIDIEARKVLLLNGEHIEDAKILAEFRKNDLEIVLACLSKLKTNSDRLSGLRKLKR